MAIVEVGGERRFIHYLGANAAFKKEDVDWDLVHQAKILHVAGSLVMPSFDGEPTAEVLKKAKEKGLTTSLDTVWDATGRWLELLKPCLSYTDIFLPSIEEAGQISGKEKAEDIASFFLERGVKIVGLKLGEKGSFVVDKDQSFKVPSYQVKAVDATGAGDAFVGGFLTGIIKGWSLELTAKFANAVGACCVEAIGATQGIKSFKETLEFMKVRPVPKAFGTDQADHSNGVKEV